MIFILLLIIITTFFFFVKWLEDYSNKEENLNIEISEVKDKNEPENDEEVDEILKEYDMFVDRKADKLDTEPKEWSEYIGQEPIKETIKETILAIQNVKDIPYPHIIVSGSAGYGKSALIHLLARKSKLPLIETIAGNLQEPKDIYRLLSRLKKEPPYSIIFIDEIHGIKKEIGELLLPAVQMFKVSNKPIPYFTLAGATTDLGLLTEKLSPLVDRCKQQFVLEAYSNEELSTILDNIRKKRNINISKRGLLEIASRARQTPRLAIGQLENIYYYALAKKIQKIEREDVINKLNKMGIYKNGITIRDIRLLKYLNNNEKPVGQSAITQKLNLDKKTYMNNIEPFLVRNDFINRTPRGRIITELGREYIKNRKE